MPLEKIDTLVTARTPVILRTSSLRFSPATEAEGGYSAKAFIDAIWVANSRGAWTVRYGQLWDVATWPGLDLESFLAGYNTQRFSLEADTLALWDKKRPRAYPLRPGLLSKVAPRLHGLHAELTETGQAEVPSSWTGWYSLTPRAGSDE